MVTLKAAEQALKELYTGIVNDEMKNRAYVREAEVFKADTTGRSPRRIRQGIKANLQKRIDQKQLPNDKCTCGSGKKYKYCCG